MSTRLVGPRPAGARPRPWLSVWPWTPRLKKIFDKAGMSMEDPANKIKLPGHKGPHPQEYHEIVFDDLDRVTKNCVTQQECARALRKALGELAAEITRKGSRLNRLLTERKPR